MNLQSHWRNMGDAAALSIAKHMMEGYNLEGECLSLYGGSDFINIGQTEKAIKLIELRPYCPQNKNTHMTKRESCNYSATPLLSSKLKYTYDKKKKEKAVTIRLRPCCLQKNTHMTKKRKP